FFAAAALPIGAWVSSSKVQSSRFKVQSRYRTTDHRRQTTEARSLRSLTHYALRITHYAVPAAVSVGLLLMAWLNVNYYFNRYYSYRPEFEIRAAQNRYEAALGTGYRVRNVGRTWQPYDVEANSYLIKGQDIAQIYNPSAELPLPAAPGKGLAFIFLSDSDEYRPI